MKNSTLNIIRGLTTKKKRNIDDYLVFFLVIFSLNFFSAKFATTSTLIKGLTFLFLIGIVAYSATFFFKKVKGFILPVMMICLSIAFSFIVTYISWGQGLIHSLSGLPFLTWFAFFYLIHIQYPIYKLEKIILFYGCLYIVLYFFQLYFNSVVYFGYREEFVEDRGIIRIDFPGGGVFFLSFFIALTKCFKHEKYQLYYRIFCIIAVIVTILQVTRQSIAVILIVGLFHIMKKVSIVKKILVLCLFTGLIFWFYNSDNPISKGLVEKQKETESEGKDYIRVLAGEYFLYDFSPNNLSKIFGNGFPNNTSEYGKRTVYVQQMYGYFASDLGLIGLYVLFGIFPIIAFIIIFIKSFLAKVPEEYYYIKYYMFFLLATCLTSDYTFSLNYLFTTIFVLYCYQTIYEKKVPLSIIRLR